MRTPVLPDAPASSPSHATTPSHAPPSANDRSRQPEPFARTAEQLALDMPCSGRPYTPNTLETGSLAERRAVELLVRKGYAIVERNYRTKLGELDIIARDGATLVFVEVRSRRTAMYGTALEAVGWRKQRKVTRVAMQYLAWRKPRFVGCRFDVVGITADEIVHVQDAWRLTRG